MGEATDEVRSIDDFNQSRVGSSSGTSTPQGQPDSSEGSQEATDIRSGIEKTRANLSDTIDALQDKLDPTRIAEQVKDQIREKATEAFDTAKHAVKEATIGKAGKIMSSVSETVTDMTGRAGTAVSDTSSSVVKYIRENPVPFALVGIGLGMLAVSKRSKASHSINPSAYDRFDPSDVSTSQATLSSRARDAASGVAEKARDAATTVADSARSAAERTTTAVSSAASSVRDAASSAADTTLRQYHDVTNQARQGAKVASDRFTTTLQENPMVLGVAALAVGAVVGLTLPTTQVEGQYMGEARDKLVDQAKSVAQEAAQKVQRVTEEAGRTFKDAAQKEGLVPTQGEDSPKA